jgi:hypothetical protein
MGDLNKLDLLSYTPTVSVTLVEGTIRDIALIDIVLTDEGGINTFNKTYMIK